MRRGDRTDYKTRSTCLDAAALPGRAGSAMRFQPAFGIERKGWSFGPEGGGNSQGIIRAGRPADELSRAARGTEKERGRSFCAGQVRLMVWTQQRAAAAQEVQASGGDHSTRDDGTTGGCSSPTGGDHRWLRLSRGGGGGAIALATRARPCRLGVGMTDDLTCRCRDKHAARSRCRAGVAAWMLS
jgi:hypothetical protein